VNTYAAKVRRARDARLVAWRALITAYASGVDLERARAAYDYADKVCTSVRAGLS